MSHKYLACGLTLVISLLPVPLFAETTVPNGSFEVGDQKPDNWSLTAGEGGWYKPAADGNRAVFVQGDGSSSNAWLSTPVPLAGNTVYRLRFQACRPQGTGGLAMTGPVFCNRDLSSLTDRWTTGESFFVTPRNVTAEESRLRFGQWEATGQTTFDDLHLERVLPIYRQEQGVELGDGEIIRGNQYTFEAPFGRQSANHARPLAWHACSFNSNRWVFGSTRHEVVYRFAVGRSQLQGQVHAQIGWYRHGELIVAVSADGREWQPLGTMSGTTSKEFSVPQKMFPASEIWVRLTARPKPDDQPHVALQVHGVGYAAELEGEPIHVEGATQFLVIRHEDSELDVAVDQLGNAVPGIDNRVVLQLRKRTERALHLQADVYVESADDLRQPTLVDEQRSRTSPQQIRLPEGQRIQQRVVLEYEGLDVGTQRLRIDITGDAQFSAEASVVVPALHSSRYGEVLPGSSSSVGLWTCDSGWKVSQRRPLPKTQGEAVQIAAAANESEAAQLVVRPSHPLSEFRAHVSDLRDARANCIPISPIDLLKVGYVHVTRPTDATGTIGFWPDPLPPADQPRNLQPNRNYPFWIRVNVPKGTPAGVYRGVVQLRAENYEADVPLQVEVFGFELPDRMTCQTAFGFDAGLAWRYHGVTNEQQRRQVLEKYLKCLSDHHISPYNPAPLDPIDLDWENTGRWSGGERDESAPQQGNAALKLVDDSAAENVSAEYSDPIPVSGEPMKLACSHRCATPNHLFIVTLQHFDEDGNWMSGRNRDMPVSGNTTWQTFEQVITSFPVGTKSVRLRLWAALYREDGSTTGTVWYDNVTLVETESGRHLVEDGDFESLNRATPQPVFDFTAWDRAMRRAIEHYHFNTFRLGIAGLGGGTFHRRYPPSLLGFGEDTPQYQAAMKAYLEQLESHLRQRGWLDEAFVYWFDEPDPKDYEFVLNGFSKLKRWAPDLRRMLTEQVEEGLLDGPNIWCPLTPAFDMEIARKRRAVGEQFWWYVCTGPKAPYCTLFIDHPATEMRVWLWQTWKRRIRGILVWQTNYWTSSAAYPDPAHPQNPYEDPMGWVSGYSTEQGTRRPWGNGDGRFLYPPEAAASGRVTEPILAAPVSSIRLEMLRDGLEDYEYFVLLEQLLAARGKELDAAKRTGYERLLEVPDDVSTDLTNFTQSPAPIAEHRRTIARAIEQLSTAQP